MPQATVTPWQTTGQCSRNPPLSSRVGAASSTASIGFITHLGMDRRGMSIDVQH